MFKNTMQSKRLRYAGCLQEDIWDKAESLIIHDISCSMYEKVLSTQYSILIEKYSQVKLRRIIYILIHLP